MTTIGEIRLHYKRRKGLDLVYESENGGYRLIVPREPDFKALPDYIDVKIATEERWLITEGLQS